MTLVPNGQFGSSFIDQIVLDDNNDMNYNELVCIENENEKISRQ